MATGGGELDVKASTITDNLGGTEQINTGSELLVDSGHLTLTGDGSGKVVLSGTALISGASKSDELENVNKTISGAGTISNLDLVNDSAGTIDATGILAIDTGNTITNAGLMEATGGGILQIDDNVNNASGTLLATGGGELDVKAATISDYDDGSEQINTGSELLVDSSHLTLNGDGSGQVALSGTALITGAASSDELENVNKTISGAGTISNLMLVNDGAGVIDANVSGQTLVLDTGNTISNAGLLEANGGALTIDATPVTNTGSLEATDNSTLTLSSNTVINIGGTVEVAPGSLLNFDSSGITGGTVDVYGTLELGWHELDQRCQRPQYRHAGSGKRSADHRFQLDRQFRSNRGQWRCADHRCHAGNQFRHARSDQWRNADAVGRYCRQYPWLHSSGYPQSSGVHLHRNGR